MSDLMTQEQTNVRTALKFLRARCGGWEPLAKTLGFKSITLSHVAGGRAVSASVAFRVARLAGVPVDDVLAGRYPGAGTCPYCGHKEEKPPLAGVAGQCLDSNLSLDPKLSFLQREWL